FYAERGGGAWLNEVPIHVSNIAELNQSLLVTGFPYDRRHIDRLLKYVREFLIQAHGLLRLGSAALDLCYVACGRLEGFWEFFLNPWDTAAGYLIVEEAGGKVTDFRGNPYSIYEKQILATNGKIHNAMLTILND
ncbi:MAG: inositol monophosphatase, partial [Candidatus Sumerlaeia bacterium]|nr:inositol monophosphatase [Candidatus Sumerlaeia bacterium]